MLICYVLMFMDFSTGNKKEIVLEKKLVGRESIFWRTGAKQTKVAESCSHSEYPEKTHDVNAAPTWRILSDCPSSLVQSSAMNPSLAPSGQKIPLYQIAHSRVGDKVNDMNFSIIPHFFPDIEKLKLIITPNWVKAVISCLEDSSSFPSKEEIEKRNKWVDDNVDVEIYEVKGIHSLNVVKKHFGRWSKLFEEDRSAWEDFVRSDFVPTNCLTSVIEVSGSRSHYSSFLNAKCL
ncbi:uncharacterized protein LOC113305858 [Papaver somniferum]|uniref:uncharacterized protein LOC113305858 n=1 Tax=Papaver somniferum TaxID=3469 RepID=UPI000E6FC8B6|nr:uncharacterized protein LOC113305858 [Papaver somniferum]